MSIYRKDLCATEILIWVMLDIVQVLDIRASGMAGFTYFLKRLFYF